MPSHGARLDVVRLVPAQPQQTRRVLQVHVQHHVDRQTLEQHREPRLGLGPRHASLPHAVLVATYARNACTQEGLELAAIEVTPHALLVVVVQPALLAALGALEARLLVVLRPDVDAPSPDVEGHPVHGPRAHESEKMLVQFRVAHHRVLRQPPAATTLARKTPENPAIADLTT